MPKEGLVEILERNKKLLRAEYQKGYQAGFTEAEKRSANEILADLEELELKRYSDMMRTLERLRKKYEGKLKE